MKSLKEDETEKQIVALEMETTNLKEEGNAFLWFQPSFYVVVLFSLIF